VEGVAAAEQARSEQRDDIVQISEFVLDRGRSEKERVVVGEFVDEIVAVGFFVFDVVGFVHHEDIPRTPEHRRPVSVAFCGVDTGDNAVMGVEVLKLVVVVADELEAELLAEFTLPLFGQLGGRENKHRAARLAIVHLLENHADFDSFAQPDFVGEQGLAIHLKEGSVGGIDLVFKEFDLLAVDVRERPEFGVGLARKQSIRNDGLSVERKRCDACSVGLEEVVGVGVGDLDVDEVLLVHGSLKQVGQLIGCVTYLGNATKHSQCEWEMRSFGWRNLRSVVHLYDSGGLR